MGDSSCRLNARRLCNHPATITLIHSNFSVGSRISIRRESSSMPRNTSKRADPSAANGRPRMLQILQRISRFSWHSVLPGAPSVRKSSRQWAPPFPAVSSPGHLQEQTSLVPISVQRGGSSPYTPSPSTASRACTCHQDKINKDIPIERHIIMSVGSSPGYNWHHCSRSRWVAGHLMLDFCQSSGGNLPLYDVGLQEWQRGCHSLPPNAIVHSE